MATLPTNLRNELDKVIVAARRQAESGARMVLQALAVELTRLMLISPMLFGLSGMVTGILNARQHFWAPALAPMMYNASIIFGALVLTGPFGVHGLALGVVIGSAGHLLVQLPALRLVGMRWRPTLDFGADGVREVARLMGPRMVGLAAAQVNLIVVVFFASFVSDAAISAVNYAFLIAMLPVGVVGRRFRRRCSRRWRGRRRRSRRPCCATPSQAACA